jgi:acetoin utilization deacetylase AcuC-like enzyme
LSVLFATHPAYQAHAVSPGHPERPSRLQAVLEGVEQAGVSEALSRFAPRPASRAELERVHSPAYLERLEALCRSGGGHLDPDTEASAGSWEASVLAAGAGLDAAARLEAGQGEAAFLAVRPPGHHALAGRAMGFCLVNNVAVLAAALAEQGERVMVLDWDVHHGNGTQDIFYEDPRVLFVSFHQHPLYPGTGSLDEMGAGAGYGTTVNIPVPAGTTGDAYLLGFDQVVFPAAEDFGPSWLLVSAGFDAHRDDPLAGVALTAGDFAELTLRAMQLAPPGRRVLFLEGGYDLEALAMSAGACLAALAGSHYRPEPASSTAGGGPGAAAVEEARRRLAQR